jgi:hypothetical protein
MARKRAPWAPPLVEMADGITGHLLAWERHERDGSWWAWVSWIQESGDRRLHTVVQVRAGSLRPLEPPWPTAAKPGRVAEVTAEVTATPPGTGPTRRIVATIYVGLTAQ